MTSNYRSEDEDLGDFDHNSDENYIESEGCDITSLSDFGTPKVGNHF